MAIMTNSCLVPAWLGMGSLVLFELNGQCVFPVYASFGCITATYMAFAAKDESCFPESGDMGTGEGVSEDGKFYRFVFHGGRRYTYDEVLKKRLVAEDALI